MAADQHVVAVDVGGTSIKAALVDRDLRAVETLREPTRRVGEVADVGQIAELVNRLGAGHDVVGAGVAVPGVVDDELGLVRTAVNLGWHDVPLRAELESATSVPLLVRHDVRTGGLAEFTVGAGKGAADAMFLPVGTGIAAAVQVDGAMLGASGYAGEIGHLIVDPGGAVCGCGARGCLETLAAAPAFARRYAERTGRTITDAAGVAGLLATDPDARAVWRDAVDALATALQAAVTLFGPSVIVIGGGVAEAGEALIAPLREELLNRLQFQRRPDVVRAALGQDAGRVGAALLGWQAADKL
ncbi:ROK family protein [Actinokineospora globicatena]|uniref:ROK family protein n=1 Tax=Actinokineospora globicatena TaxID=103729 RepID=UPI0020A2A4A4|nr:ROK family protein [Actinokineospora globicatena]MCP2304902.1 glucokinase [Actinokineospora globicatena]GLW77717.1 glucokinase [Actinokineospora globicatena]GLW85614.1 glucokinase [Actinokineospora globicatena]